MPPSACWTPTSAGAARRRRGALLRGYLRSYPQLELLDVLYPKSPPLHGDAAAALEFLRNRARSPSLTGLGRLIEAQLPGLERNSGGRRRGAPWCKATASG